MPSHRLRSVMVAATCPIPFGRIDPQPCTHCGEAVKAEHVEDRDGNCHIVVHCPRHGQSFAPHDPEARAARSDRPRPNRKLDEFG